MPHPPQPEPPTHDFDRTRRSLLTRLKNWDDQAGWREFMDRYGRLIFSVARRSGLSAEEAEDIVQETLVAVARRIPSFRYQGDKGSFKAWLMMIVRSRIIDLRRRKGCRVQDAGALPAGEAGETAVEARVPQGEDEFGHEAIWQAEWESHVLAAAMARVKERVSPRHFLAFRLCADQGQSPSQVARTLGISLPRVYLIRHRVGRLVAEEIRKLSQDE